MPINVPAPDDGSIAAYDDSGTAGSPTLTVVNTSRGSGELATCQVASDGRIRITKPCAKFVIVLKDQVED